MGRTKRGRPKKPGPRHPGGQLKQQDAGIPGASLQRLRALGTNPLIATQVGRLLYLGELTETEAAAAYRIGEIYGRYEQSIGRRRSVASPSYEAGRGRDIGLTESDSAAARAESAARAFGALQADLALCPRGVRPAIEELCVEDRACPPGWLPVVKIALGILAVELGITRRRMKPSPPSAAKMKHSSGQEEIFSSIAANLADMDGAKSSALYEHFKNLYEEEKFQQGRQERERFRKGKRSAQ